MIYRVFIFALALGILFYLSHQLTRFADFSPMVSLSILGLVFLNVAIILTLPIYFWDKPEHEYRPWHDQFFAVVHTCVAYLNFLVIFVLGRDLIGLFTNYLFTNLYLEKLYSAEATWVLLALPCLVIVIGTLVVRSGPHLLKVPIQFKDLPKDLEGLRILHITDLHIGRGLPKSFIHKLIRVAEKNPADLVVYTGDILDDVPARYHEDVELLKTIPSRFGNYYVPGNHEYYWGGLLTMDAFKRIDFTVLLNQSADIKIGTATLQICGVPDPFARHFRLEGPDFEKLAKTFQPGAFRVLLSHQPSIADEASKYDFDVQLSGHTHGGQFFPWNVLLGLFEKYGKGLFDVGRLKLYVNQGAGYWGPSLRVGTHCEVAEIILKKSSV